MGFASSEEHSVFLRSCMGCPNKLGLNSKRFMRVAFVNGEDYVLIHKKITLFLKDLKWLEL